MRSGSQEVNVDSPANVPSRPWLLHIYLWACERLYYELAWAYDAVSWIVSLGQWRRWQAGAWSEVQGEDVLEVGFGTGAMLVQGQRHGLRMVGVDRSPEMVRVAQRRMGRGHVVCPVVVADGRNLPIMSRAFDSVLATFPASYILERETLNEIYRVLRTGGRLVIVGLWIDVNLGGLERMLPLFYGRPRAERLDGIALDVESAGFNTQWKEQRSGRFTVGVFVAERKL